MSTSRNVCTFLGPTGSGKTYLWRQLSAHFSRPLYAIDRVGDLQDFGLCVESAEHLRRYLLASTNGDVQPPDHHRYVIEQATQQNGAALFALAVRANLSGTFVVDEAHNWYGVSSQNDHLHQILMEGRHHSQSVIFCSRRAQNIGKNALNESAIFCFGISDPGGKKRAAKYLGPTVSPEDVGTLDEHQFLIGGRTATLPAYVGEQTQDDPTGKVLRWDDSTNQIQTLRDL